MNIRIESTSDIERSVKYTMSHAKISSPKTEQLHADDWDIVTHSEHEMHRSISRFVPACKAFV